MKKNLVYQIAKQCREVSEKFVGSMDAHGMDFFNPNAKRDLFCFCACGSIFLTSKLKENGINAVTVVGDCAMDCEEEWNHCWTEVDGKYIVDITATQFNWAKDMPVIIGTYKQYAKRYRKRMVDKLPHDWPVTQKPNDRVIKKLNKLFNERVQNGL